MRHLAKISDNSLNFRFGEFSRDECIFLNLAIFERVKHVGSTTNSATAQVFNFVRGLFLTQETVLQII